MNNLTFVPTADLLDALFGRYDNAVFHGTLARPVSADDKSKLYTIRTTGDQYYAMGLAQEIILFCHEETAKTQCDLDPTDL